MQHRLQRKQAQTLLQQSSWIFPLSCGLGVLLLAVVMALALIEYKETETARGTLMAQQPPLKLVAPQAGVVDLLRVELGQFVRPGEVLASISMVKFDESGIPVSKTDLDMVEAEQQALLEQARLNEDRFLQQQRALENQMADLESQLSLAGAAVQTLEEQLRISESLLAATAILLENGSISKAHYEQQRLAYLQLETEQQSSLAGRLALQRELNLIRAQGDELELQWSTEQLQLDQSLRLLELKEQRTKNLDTIAIVAQREGYVASINVAAGDAVGSGQPLLYVQPARESLRGEVYVPSSIVGKLAPGQELLLRYDGFAVESYGRYGATISEISRASVDPREHLLPVGIRGEPVFRVVIQPAQHYVEGDDIYPLQPGLHFSADFVIAEMSLMEFIFRPVLKLQGKVA
ncbi:MAG: HlyD family efflux transporter periplasmic adaptor subunit [Proteobacteria bacterium]|nr:HlyD family efflux transporter periplasmic adaptor subunit [Pseudomonadota bacterium]MDA0927305.1 HlyD family efflux transporter periplasmic adaptor subunit [Pseudomonadota bacterium]